MKRTLILLSILLLFPVAKDFGGEDVWHSLFDGKTLTGWKSLRGGPIRGWSVAYEALHFKPLETGERNMAGNDIYTVREYQNFILELEWKISPGANSGVKYRMAWYDNNYLGPEFQIVDESRPKKSEKREPTLVTGAMYALSPADFSKHELRPVGAWNQARIVADGKQIEHWLNGKRVVKVDLAKPAFKDAVLKSKFKKWPDYAQNPSGRIMLQDHGHEVWFRKIRIRELP